MSITFTAAIKRSDDSGTVIDHTGGPEELEVQLSNMNAFDLMDPVLRRAPELGEMDYCGAIEPSKLDRLVSVLVSEALQNSRDAYKRTRYAALVKLAIHCRLLGKHFAWA